MLIKSQNQSTTKKIYFFKKNLNFTRKLIHSVQFHGNNLSDSKNLKNKFHLINCTQLSIILFHKSIFHIKQIIVIKNISCFHEFSRRVIVCLMNDHL